MLLHDALGGNFIIAESKMLLVGLTEKNQLNTFYCNFIAEISFRFRVENSVQP